MSTVQASQFGYRRGIALLGRSIATAPGAISLAVGAVLWEVIGRVAEVRFFPPLSNVLVRLVEMTGDGLILESLAASLANLVLGLAISVVGGVAVGALMGAYPRVYGALDVYVYALLTAPALVFAPIFFSIFGTDRASIVAVIVVYTVFIIIVNTADGIRSVSPPLIQMARSFNASDRQILFRIMLPAAMPMILTGIRLGTGRAVKGMINGEMFIAVVGLGRVVSQAGGRFDGESVLAILLVIIVVALVAVRLVQVLDRRLTSWVPETARGA